MEGVMKRISRSASETRELTDKELTAMTREIGRGVRSQTVAVSKIVQANLEAEFAAHRKLASKLLKSKKTVAA
jgi:hypothetical protein